MIEINKLAPEFEENAFIDGKVRTIKLNEYRGQWVVLFFYPADFTFVCPTELGELADNYQKFKDLDCEIISVSTDTAFVHKAWADNSPTIAKIKFPMLADPTGRVCKAYNTYIPDEGLSLRGTFFIDPEGVLKAYELHDNSIGRSVKEIVRKIQATKFVKENEGKVCPVNWEPGAMTLTPGLNLVGKI
jgi:NADH-dependent peroxiredoxin subunit C